jgi:transcriptional regulator with GAF, ATPase, and Fis domain
MESLVEAVLRKRSEPPMWTGPLPPMPEPKVTLESATMEFRRQFVRAALQRNARNQRTTARELGIGYSTLKAFLRRMRIEE